jgi:hypothetical protein
VNKKNNTHRELSAENLRKTLMVGRRDHRCTAPGAIK